MTTHDALKCPDGCYCRHVWGSCDCVVCTSKREQVKKRGNAMLRDVLFNQLAHSEPGQGTLADFENVEVES